MNRCKARSWNKVTDFLSKKNLKNLKNKFFATLPPKTCGVKKAKIQGCEVKSWSIPGISNSFDSKFNHLTTLVISTALFVMIEKSVSCGNPTHGLTKKAYIYHWLTNHSIIDTLLADSPTYDSIPQILLCSDTTYSQNIIISRIITISR